MSLADTIARKESIAGIDIADGVVSAARVVRRRRGPITLTHGGWAEYAQDAPDAEIAQAIRRLWKKARMPTHTVCGGLHSRSLCLKYFKYPDLSSGELASALKLEAEESMQLPPDQIMLDWHLNRPKEHPNMKRDGQLNGILVGVAKKQVNRHLNLLKMAGLYPVMLDVGSMALCNLFLAVRGESVTPDNAVCVVNLLRYTADISILYNDHFIYPRTIISRSSEWSTKVQYLIENISDALLYYHVKVDKTPVMQLVLTGFVPRETGFVGQIHDKVGLPTEIWNPLVDEHFKISPQVKAAKGCDITSPFMATSLGLGLRNI